MEEKRYTTKIVDEVCVLRYHTRAYKLEYSCINRVYEESGCQDPGTPKSIFEFLEATK